MKLLRSRVMSKIHWERVRTNSIILFPFPTKRSKCPRLVSMNDQDWKNSSKQSVQITNIGINGHLTPAWCHFTNFSGQLLEENSSNDTKRELNDHLYPCWYLTALFWRFFSISQRILKTFVGFTRNGYNRYVPKWDFVFECVYRTALRIYVFNTSVGNTNT